MRGAGVDAREGEYERYRAVVMGTLAKRFPRLDEDERLAIYHDAWLRVIAKRKRGEKIMSLRAYLLATTGAEALHLVSRGRRPIPIGPDDPRLTSLLDEGPSPEEQAVTRDQARIARDLLETLDERQRDVLKLRWDLQLSGAEVRTALGLSERQYRRLAEEGATALAERVEQLQNGQWSRRTRSLLVACLIEVGGDDGQRVGIASRRQRAEAQRLLESDPHVAALYAEVVRTVRGVTALLPLPAFAAMPDRAPIAHLTELLADARSHVSTAVDTIKHQTTSLYLRAADPALLSGGGPRPGAAVVAVAGALALGGGTYGAYEAVTSPSTPVAAPAPAVVATPSAAVSKPPPAVAAQPTTPRPPARPKRRRHRVDHRPSIQAPPPAQPTAAPAPPTSSTPTPPTPQPRSTTEFGFED
jgi:RNA polymerase sigma factor (sigma-70 family)